MDTGPAHPVNLKYVNKKHSLLSIIEKKKMENEF